MSTLSAKLLGDMSLGELGELAGNLEALPLIFKTQEIVEQLKQVRDELDRRRRGPGTLDPEDLRGIQTGRGIFDLGSLSNEQRARLGLQAGDVPTTERTPLLPRGGGAGGITSRPGRGPPRSTFIETPEQVRARQAKEQRRIQQGLREGMQPAGRGLLGQEGGEEGLETKESEDPPQQAGLERMPRPVRGRRGPGVKTGTGIAGAGIATIIGIYRNLGGNPKGAVQNPDGTVTITDEDGTTHRIDPETFKNLHNKHQSSESIPTSGQEYDFSEPFKFPDKAPYDYKRWRAYTKEAARRTGVVQGRAPAFMRGGVTQPLGKMSN